MHDNSTWEDTQVDAPYVFGDFKKILADFSKFHILFTYWMGIEKYPLEPFTS